MFLAVAFFVFIFNGSIIIAEEEKESVFRIGGHFGYNWIKDPDISTLYKENFYIGFNTGYMVLSQLEISGALSLFCTTDTLTESIDWRLNHLMLGAYYHLSRDLNVPHLKAGGGIEFGSYTLSTPLETIDESNTGYWLSGGVEIPLIKNLIIDIQLRFISLEIQAHGYSAADDLSSIQLFCSINLVF